MPYTNTFIAISKDCPAETGQIPPLKALKSKARIEYELLSDSPYGLDHDGLIYAVHCAQKGADAMPRDAFLAKGRACLRASALVKRYGWGAHYDAQGRIALFATGSPEYARVFAECRVLYGLRSKRG